MKQNYPKFRIEADYGNEILNKTGNRFEYFETAKDLITAWKKYSPQMKQIRTIIRQHDKAKGIVVGNQIKFY